MSRISCATISAWSSGWCGIPQPIYSREWQKGGRRRRHHRLGGDRTGDAEGRRRRRTRHLTADGDDYLSMSEYYSTGTLYSDLGSGSALPIFPCDAELGSELWSRHCNDHHRHWPGTMVMAHCNHALPGTGSNYRLWRLTAHCNLLFTALAQLFLCHQRRHRAAKFPATRSRWLRWRKRTFYYAPQRSPDSDDPLLQQAAAADGEFVGNDLGLGRQQGGPMRRLDGICLTGFEGVGRNVERFSRRQHDGLCGEGAAGDLADGLLQEGIVGRGFAGCIIECSLARLDQRRGITQNCARDAGIDRGQEELRKGVGIGNAVAGVGASNTTSCRLT